MNAQAKKKSTAISDLRNLGPKSQEMLGKVGIRTLAQLTKTGAVPAYVRVKRAMNSSSLNLLYGLVGSIEDIDWRIVQRERKLELLNEIEEFERTHPSETEEKGLHDLRNIGKAMLSDFDLLGIKTVKQLAKCDADELYDRIQTLTHTRHDPCVWDTYAAAIHEAKTGERLNWWAFTKVRKARASSSLPLPLWERDGERGSSKRSKQTLPRLKAPLSSPSRKKKR